MEPTPPRRVAIIGCGYVGTALGAALVRAGHNVVGTTRTPDRQAALQSAGIEPVLLDTADPAQLARVLADRDAAYLLVAAGRRNADYRATYLESVRNLVAVLPELALRRLIYTSSTRVHAQDDGAWVDETSPTEPVEANGQVLVETERTLLEGARAARSDMHVSVVRLSGIYGPGRDPADFVLRAAGTERSDGDAWVNLVHRDDIVHALMLLLDCPHHGVLNLSDDTPRKRRALYDPILARAGATPIRWLAAPGAGGAGKRVRNALIKQTLGLTLAHPRCGE